MNVPAEGSSQYHLEWQYGGDTNYGWSNSGTDYFIYTLIDGLGERDTTTVWLYVSAVDDAPQIAGQSPALEVNEGQTAVTAPSDVGAVVVGTE